MKDIRKETGKDSGKDGVGEKGMVIGKDWGKDDRDSCNYGLGNEEKDRGWRGAARGRQEGSRVGVGREGVKGGR